jgi:hypothetical protein
MKNQQLIGWTLVTLVAASYVMPVLCYPGLTPLPEPRKFAEKPNALKKVAIDNDLDDVSTNQISVSTSALVTLLILPVRSNPTMNVLINKYEIRIVLSLQTLDITYWLLASVPTLSVYTK